jgi:hypothetical protein
MRTVLAAVLLLVGIVALAGGNLLRSHESLPYSSDAPPPQAAQVTRDQTYSLAVPGGVKALVGRGADTQSGDSQVALLCTWTLGSSTPQPLALTAEDVDTKATNTIARFVAPVSGGIRVACSGWGPVYIPDADNRATDWSGVLVLLSCVTLTLGMALGLSAAYAASRHGATANGPGADQPAGDEPGVVPDTA